MFHDRHDIIINEFLIHLIINNYNILIIKYKTHVKEIKCFTLCVYLQNIQHINTIEQTKIKTFLHFDIHKVTMHMHISSDHHCIGSCYWYIQAIFTSFHYKIFYYKFQQVLKPDILVYYNFVEYATKFCFEQT